MSACKKAKISDDDINEDGVKYNFIWLIDPIAMKKVYEAAGDARDAGFDVLAQRAIDSGVEFAQPAGSDAGGQPAQRCRTWRPTAQDSNVCDDVGADVCDDVCVTPLTKDDVLGRRRAAMSRYIAAAVAVQELSAEIRTLRNDPATAEQRAAEQRAQIVAMKEFRELGAAARKLGAAARAARALGVTARAVNRRRAKAAGRTK